MTPQEKAKELVDRFYKLENVESMSEAKQCALIAADEINNTLSGCNNYYELDETIEFWQQVKQEIEKK